MKNLAKLRKLLDERKKKCIERLVKYYLRNFQVKWFGSEICKKYFEKILMIFW